jgi:predicted nucleotidyltransferase
LAVTKIETYNQYPREATDLAEKALLTVWGSLTRFHADLVLVGGLAVKCSTRPPEADEPGAVTLDVDFGIHMGVDSRMYSSMRETLQAHGFQWQGQRFVRQVGNLDLHVDLLTDGEEASSTVIVDDGLPVAVVPGISRALESAWELPLSGKNLLEADSLERIRVSGAGPLLVLKLNAFGGPTGRRAPKDAHDILYLAANHHVGIRQVVDAFHAERAAGNRGLPGALSALEKYYANENAEAPMACAAFRLDNRHLHPTFREESLRIRQQCVTLAKALLQG